MKQIKHLSDRFFFKGLSLQERLELSNHMKATFNSESGRITLKYLLFVSGITDYNQVISNEKALLIREGMQRLVKTCLKHSAGDIDSLLEELQANTRQKDQPAYNYTGVDSSEPIE